MNNLMKFILFLYLITILKAHPSEKPPAGRIIGGHEAWPHSHPYIVSLQLRILGLRVHYCGGSLLSHYWVLTAGHCVRVSWFYQLFLLDVAAGAHNVYNHDMTTQFRTVEKRVPHPQYLGGITENDIALLKVNFPFKYTSAVQPIRLPESKNANLKNLVLSGWGALKTTYFLPAMPDLLQEVKVSYISYKDCYRALEDLEEDGAELLLKENIHICTGPLYGGVAACSGDSGGPLIAYIDSNTSIFNIDYLNDFLNEEHETLEEEESSTTPGSFWSRLQEIVDKYFSPNEFVNSNELNDHSNNIDNKEIIIHKQHADVQIERIPIVVGVVSWGITPCGYKGAPSVYTNVSHYMDFIRKYINT